MASNSIANYLGNLGKSIKYAAIETVKEQMPVTSNFIVTNKDTVRETYKSIIDSKHIFTKLGTIEDNTIFKTVSRGFNNIKTDVMSGNFYHPERTDPMAQLGALSTLMSGLGNMGGEFEELSNILGEDQEENPDYTKNPEYLVTKGDALVASSLIKVTSTSTNCMGKLITKLHENRMKTTRAIADMQLAQSQRNLILQQTGFNSMAQGFNSLIDFNNQIMRTHIENSRVFYENMTNISRDSNSILHALHDMQESVYRSQNPKSESGNMVNIDTIFRNGFDIKAYSNMLKQKATKSPLGAIYTAMMSLPVMMEDMISNPMHEITKFIMKGAIGPNLGMMMSRFDKTIEGAFSTGLAKLYDYGARNEQSFVGKLAKMFGFKQDNARLSSVDASKFNKGAMSWNGIAQKSLVEVIPGHLRRIEASLTGQGERIMNFQTGKWTTSHELKNLEKRIDSKLAKDSTANIEKQLQAVLNTLTYKSEGDRRNMKNTASSVMKGVWDKGYLDFDDINLNKSNKYGKDGLVQLIASIMRSILPTGEAAKLTNQIAKSKQAKAQMINGTSYEDTSLVNEFANGSMNGTISKARGIRYNPNGKSPATLLTELTDKHGYSLYDYQYMILNELRQGNGGGGGNGGPGGGPNPPRGPIPDARRDSYDPYTRGERKSATHERAQNYVQDKNFRDYGFNREEGSTVIDTKSILNDPNSRESKAMIEQIVSAAVSARDVKDRKSFENESNIISKLLRGQDNDSSKLPDGINPNAGLAEQLIQAANIGEKFDVIRHNLSKIGNIPSNLMAGIIGKADESVYDILFGKDTGEKDQNGRPILGIFHKMMNELDISMDNLNGTIDSMTNKIKDFFSDRGGIIGTIKSGINSLFGVDVDEHINNAKERYLKPVGRAAKRAVFDTAKDVGGDIHNAVMSTFFDMGLVSKEGKFDFGNLFGNIGQHATGAKNVKSGGLAIISPGEAIIPANMNPWNPNRNNVDIQAQYRNESNMKNSIISNYKDHFAKMGAAIPMHAGGTTNTAADIIIQQLVSAGIDADEINSIISANTDIQRQNAKNKVLQAHHNDKTIDSLLKHFSTVLTSEKFASTGTKLKLTGVRHDDKTNTVKFRSASGRRARNLTKQSNLADKSYTHLGAMRDVLNDYGYGDLMPSDEEIGQKKFNNRQGPITGFRQATLQATGTDPVKAMEMAKNFTVKNASSLGKGGAIGALLSAVFPLGGPLLGSLIGAGVSTLSKNESFQKYVFGEEVVDESGKTHKEGGILSQKVVDIYNKYVPDAKKYGITGAIAGLVTPFGPLGGAMIGAGASILKNNKTLNNFLFGDSKGLLNKDRKAAIKRAFPHMAAAMLGTFFLGPFGLLGNAVLGAGIGLVSTTESFKRLMLGAKGRDGVRRGGIAGAIRRQITQPFKRTMQDMREKLGDWFKDKIFTPVSHGLKPIGKLAGSMVRHGFNSLFAKLGRGVKGSFLGNLVEKGLRKVRQAGGGLKGAAKWLIGKPMEAVAGKISKLGDKASKFAVTHGYGDMYSAEERAKIFHDNGIVNSNSAADNSMANMSDSNIHANSQLAGLVNAHLNGSFKNKIDNQRQDELDYFENDLMKLEEGKDTKSVDALSKIRKELYAGLKGGKILPQDVPDIVEKINNAEGLDQKTKNQIIKMHGNAFDNINRINNRAAEESKGTFLNGSLDSIRKNFGLGNISDAELKKMMPSLARNLSNEVDVRRDRKDALAEESKKLNEEEGKETNPSDELQKESNAYSSEMVDQLKEINKTLLGIATGKVGSKDNQLLKNRLDYANGQSDILMEAYGDRAGEMFNKRQEKFAGLRSQMGAQENGPVSNLSDDNLSKLGLGANNSKSASMRKVSTYLAEFEKHEINHGAKIENADKIIELSEKMGVDKVAERIFTLSMYGYTIKESDYESIAKWSDTAYGAAKQLAKLGAKFDDFKLFSKIRDDVPGRKLAQDIVGLAAVKNKDNNAIATVMTVGDIKKKLEGNDEFNQAKNAGRDFQSIYDDQTQNGEATDLAFHSANDKMRMSNSRSKNFNSGYNADEAIDDAQFSKLGDKFMRIAESLMDHYFSATKEKMNGIRDAAFDDYDQFKGNEIGTTRTNHAAKGGNKFASKYMRNARDYANSTTKAASDAVTSRDDHLSFNKFQTFKESKKYQILSKMSDEELENFIDETPEASRSMIQDMAAHAKGDSIGQHAFGLKSMGAAAAAVGSTLLGAGKEFGKNMLGSFFGMNGDGSDKKSDDSDNAVEQAPKAQMVNANDSSNAISAIMNATNAGGSAGNMMNQKDKDGETFAVPTAEGDVIRYGKSKVDGSPMKIKDKNNMEVESKVKHKAALQERSTKALENIAKKIGAVGTGAGGVVKKKAKGLLDMLKDLAGLPKTLLNGLIPGLGTALYAGLGAGAGYLGKKALSALTNKFGLIKGLRTKLGERIAKGGLLGGILNKTMGGLALNGEEALAKNGAEAAGAKYGESALDAMRGAQSAAEREAAEKAAQKGGGGLLSKVLPHMGKVGKVLAGLGAAYGGYKLLSPSTAEAAQNNQVMLDENGQPIVQNIQNSTQGPWALAKDGIALTAAGGAGYAAKHAIEGTNAVQRIENSSLVGKIGQYAKNIIPKSKLGREAAGIGLVGGALGLIPKMVDPKTLAISYGKGTVNNEILENGGIKDHKEQTLADKLPAISASIGGGGLGSLLAGKLGGGAKTKLAAGVLGSALGSSAVSGQLPSLQDLLLSGGFTYGWDKVSNILKHTKEGATSGEGLISATGAGKGLLKGIGDGLPKSRVGRIAALAAGAFGLSSMLGGSNGAEAAGRNPQMGQNQRMNGQQNQQIVTDPQTGQQYINPNYTQTNPEGGGMFGTLANLGGSILGGKLGSKLFKGHGILGSALGATIGGATADGVTGNGPITAGGLATDMALNAGFSALPSLYRKGKAALGFGGAEAASTAAKAGVETGESALDALRNSRTASTAAEDAAKGGKGLLARLIPKSKFGKVLALGAGLFGAHSLLSSDDQQQQQMPMQMAYMVDPTTGQQIPVAINPATGQPMPVSVDPRTGQMMPTNQINPNQQMNPNGMPNGMPNGTQPNTSSQGGGLLNTVGSWGGMLGGGMLGRRLFKGHSIFGSALGAAIGGAGGDWATGGESPSIGGMATDMAMNAGMDYAGRKAKSALGFGTEIAEGAAKTGAEGGESALDAMRNAQSGAAKDGKMAEKGQEILTKAKDMMNKILPSIEKWLPSKGAKAAVQNFFGKILESMAKPQNMAKGLAKLAKQGAAAAAGAGSFGIGYAVLTAGFAIADFLKGYNDADEMLKLKEGTATTGMKVASGLVTAVCGAVPFIGAFLPEDYILELAIEYIGPAFGFGKADLDKLRQGKGTNKDGSDSSSSSSSGDNEEMDTAKNGGYGDDRFKGSGPDSGDNSGDKSGGAGTWKDKVADFAKSALIPGYFAAKTGGALKQMIFGNGEEDGKGKDLGNATDKANDYEGKDLSGEGGDSNNKQSSDNKGNFSVIKDAAFTALKSLIPGYAAAASGGKLKQMIFGNGEEDGKGKDLGNATDKANDYEGKDLGGEGGKSKVDILKDAASTAFKSLIPGYAAAASGGKIKQLLFGNGEEDGKGKDLGNATDKANDYEGKDLSGEGGESKGFSLKSLAQRVAIPGAGLFKSITGGGEGGTGSAQMPAAGSPDSQVKTNLTSLNDKDANSKIDAQALIGKVTSGIDEVAQAIQKFIPSELYDAMKSFGSALADEISKPQNLQNGLSKLSNKASSASSIGACSLAVGIGYLTVEGPKAVSNFIQGSNNASDLLKLQPGLATPNMKVLCGTVVATSAAMSFIGAFIDDDKLLEIAVNTLGPALGFSQKDIDDLRKAGDKKDETDKKDSTKAQYMSGFDGSTSSSWADKLKMTTKGIVSNVIAGATTMAGSISNKAQSLADSAKAGAQRAVDWVKDKAGAVKDWVTDHAHQGAQFIKDTAKSVYNTAKNVGSKVIDTVSDGASSLYHGAKDLASSAYHSVFGTGKHGSNLYGMGDSDQFTNIDDPSYTIPEYNKIQETDSMSVKMAKHQAQLKGLQAAKGETDTQSSGGKFYSQLDPKYHMDYNAATDSVHQTMEDSGCGPVSASNALSSLGIDVDPRIAAKFALKNGYKEANGGTMPGFFKSFMNKAGASAKDMHSSKDITNSLKNGNPVVLMGKDNRGDNKQNPYAENPHYVTATGLDNKGNIVIQDPESNTPNKTYKPSSVLSNSSVAIAAMNKNYKGPGYNKISNSDTLNVQKAKIGAQLKDMIEKALSKRASKSGKGTSRGVFGRSRYGRGTDTEANAEKIWEWLTKDQGMSNQAAAGIMGNMQQECGFDNHAYQAGGSPEEAPPPSGEGENGYGLCQWTGSRTQALIDFAKSKGTSSGDLITQLEFMKQEAIQRDSWRQVAEAQTAEEAARIWFGTYESGSGPGGQGIAGSRVEYATKILQANGKGIINSSSLKNGGDSGNKNGGNNTKKDNGLFGALGDVATILHNALMPWAAQAPDNSKPGGNNNNNGKGGGCSTNEGIQKATAWANSVIGHEGHGNNGCTQFCQDYLKQAGNPYADTMSLYVPTIMENAKAAGMWKEPSDNGSEGDMAILETNNNRDDGPDHAVIYDGKGGCWGNSSSKNQFLYYSNMLDSFPGGLWGYVSTGAGDNGSVAQKGGNTRSNEEADRDASMDGKGKHLLGSIPKFGMGKHSLFGRAKGVDNKEAAKFPHKNYAAQEKSKNKSTFGKYKYGTGVLEAVRNVFFPPNETPKPTEDEEKPTTDEEQQTTEESEDTQSDESSSDSDNSSGDKDKKDNKDSKDKDKKDKDKDKKDSKNNTNNNNNNSSSGGKWGFLTSMAKKVADPISKIMTSFGDMVSKASKAFMNNPVMKDLFGDMNPFLDALGISSNPAPTNNNNNNNSGDKSNKSNGGHTNITQDGSVADIMLKALPGCVIPDGGEFGVPRENHAYGHGGIDICPNDNSTPQVPTPVSGTVHDVNTEHGYGNYVQVEDSAGNFHIFGHLESQCVTKGDSISAGDYVGTMGNTGNSHGVHVHYEVDGPDNEGASANLPHINPHEYMPPSSGKGKHSFSKYGRGTSSLTDISDTVTGVQPEGNGLVAKYSNMKQEAASAGYTIPPYNLITDSDGDAIKALKSKFQKDSIEEFKRNMIKMKSQKSQYGKGPEEDLNNTRSLKSVPRPRGEIFPLPGNFGIDQKMQKASTYGKGISIPRYDYIPGLEEMLEEANRYKSFGANGMYGALHGAPKLDAPKLKEDKPSNAITEYQNLENTEGYTIPEYDIIQPDDSNAIKEAKYKAQMKGFAAYKKAKAEAENKAVGPTPSAATVVSKDANGDPKTNKYAKLGSDVQKTSDEAKRIQDGNVDVIDDVAPNGKHYSKNDYEYLLKQGYSKEDAIAFLANDKKYSKDGKNHNTEENLKAPNGKTYSKNDIDYLMNQGYTRADAIVLLAKDDKYSKDANDKKKMLAPNGKKYSKNDIDYLLKKGYSEKDAIEFLSKNNKYSKDGKDHNNEENPKAPNGKEYAQNDIDYLLKKGYSKEDAIQFLSKDKKYSEDGKDHNGTDANGTDTDKKSNKAPNGKDYDKSDIEYYTKQGYSEKEAIEKLSKDKKYAKDDSAKAPNGKAYDQNDIDYLLKQGYSQEDALKFLDNDKKYSKDGKDHNNNSTTTNADGSQATPNGDKLDALIASQNQTNQLLTTLVQIASTVAEKYTGVKPEITTNTNTGTKETETSTNVKAVLTASGNGSNVGMGDILSGNNRERSDIMNIINTIRAVVTR